MTAVAPASNVVTDPAHASVIVDDLVDSGVTRSRYEREFPDTPFVPLFDKKKDCPGKWMIFPWEDNHEPTDAIVRLLEYIGEDPSREGLAGTPERVLKSFREMCSGYDQNPSDILTTTFNEQCDEMIVVSDIPFYSLCEHHLLPFGGTATVAYIPDRCVVGLSKIPRLVHCFANRLQIQERLTEQIATAIHDELSAIGVGCIITSNHSCMQMRGVKSSGKMTTSCLLGLMRDDARARSEFMSITGGT